MGRFWEKVPKKPDSYVPLENMPGKMPTPEELLLLKERLEISGGKMKPEERQAINHRTPDRRRAEGAGKVYLGN